MHNIWKLSFSNISKCEWYPQRSGSAAMRISVRRSTVCLLVSHVNHIGSDQSMSQNVPLLFFKQVCSQPRPSAVNTHCPHLPLSAVARCRSIARTRGELRHDTIRDAILTCARKPTWVSLIYRTEPTTKKCENRKTKSRKQICSEITVNSPGNPCSLYLRRRNEGLQWEGFAEIEGFKPGVKEWVGGHQVIVSMTVGR